MRGETIVNSYSDEQNQCQKVDFDRNFLSRKYGGSGKEAEQHARDHVKMVGTVLNVLFDFPT